MAYQILLLQISNNLLFPFHADEVKIFLQRLCGCRMARPAGRQDKKLGLFAIGSKADIMDQHAWSFPAYNASAGAVAE